MKIIECSEVQFRRDFMPIIIDLWCGNKYQPNNPQHVAWLDKSISARFADFGVALCAYNDDDTPIGYIWYKHDTGMEGVSFSGKYAHIIQMGLFDQYQGKGIGTKLMDEACRRIKSNGGECLYTDTYAKRDGSMTFYIKRGFIPMAHMQGLNGVNDLGQVYLYKAL